MYLPLGCIPPGKIERYWVLNVFQSLQPIFLKLSMLAKLGLISQELRTRYVYYFAV